MCCMGMMRYEAGHGVHGVALFTIRPACMGHDCHPESSVAATVKPVFADTVQVCSTVHGALCSLSNRSASVVATAESMRQLHAVVSVRAHTSGDSIEHAGRGVLQRRIN